MEFTEIQQLLQQTRIQRENSERELFRLKEKLSKIRREKSRLSRFARKGQSAMNIRLLEMRQHESKLTITFNELSATLDQQTKMELDRIRSFLPFTDPIENISNLDDRYPILLFPLRIETRFKHIKDGEEGMRQHSSGYVYFLMTFPLIPLKNYLRKMRFEMHVHIGPLFGGLATSKKINALLGAY